MALPAEPALRALWELGGAPAATLRALERVGEVVQQFEPELEEAEEIAQAAVAPLLAPERGVGGRALERAVAKREGEVPAAAGEVPGEGDEPVVARAPRRPRAAAGPGRARQGMRTPAAPAAEPPPRALDARALEQMAGPMPAPAEGSRANAAPGRTTRAGTAKPLAVSAADARATLSRRAERAGAAGALHAPVRAETAAGALDSPGVIAAGVPNPPGATTAAEARAADAGHREPAADGDGARPLSDLRDPAERRRRLLARRTGTSAVEGADRASGPAASGGDRSARLGAPALSAAAAKETLARRAKRAGAGNALQTTVITEVEADRPALPAAAQASRGGGAATGPALPAGSVRRAPGATRSERAPGATLPERAPGGDALDPRPFAALERSQPFSALERALARVTGRPPRRADSSPRPADAPRRPEASRGELAGLGARASPAQGASDAPLEGLAGLAARAAQGVSDAPPEGLAARAPAARRGPPPVSLAGTAPPQPPIPAVLAERMEEAQLARRLERILRREAEQAGVDLEELDP